MADNKIVVDSSDVDKAKSSLKDLNSQLGLTDNAAVGAEGKIRGLAEALKAANAAPLASGLLIVTAALGGAAIAAKSFMDSFAESASTLNNLSTKTGVAVEALSVMQQVAKLSGTSMDTVTNSIVKFERSIAASAKETSIQAKAFKELGIDTSDTSKTTEEYLSMAADKLNGLHDGWQKNNITMALFGKGASEINEFLGDYAERGDLAAKVTKQQAQEAEDYERSLKRLEATTNSYKNLIGSALLPVAKSLLDEFTAMTGNASKLDDAQKNLVKSTVADWAFGIARGFAATLDVGIIFWDFLKGLGQYIGTLSAAMVTESEVWHKILTGDFTGAWELQKTNASLFKDGVVTAFQTATTFSTKYYDAVNRGEEKYRENLNKTYPADQRPTARNIGVEDTTAKQEKSVSESGYTAAAKREEDALIRLRGEYLKLFGIRQDTHVQLLQASIDAGEFAAKYDKQGNLIKMAATEEELAMLKGKAAQADYMEGVVERTKADKAAWEQVQKTTEEETKKIETMRRSINEGNIQREVMKQYGATQNDVTIAINDYNIAQAQTALTIAKLTNASEQEIATLEVKLQTLREIGVLQKDKKADDDLELARQKSFSYGWEQSFKKYQDDAGNAASHAQSLFQTASKGMEDSFVNFARTGKLSFADMTQSILSDLIRIAAQKAAAGMMNLAMLAIGSKDGNVFGPSGILKSANGNVFDGPTMHGYSGGVGMLGEAGPEAVMPLKRNAQGQLGVVTQGGGSQTNNIHVSVTVQGGNTNDETGNTVANKVAEQFTRGIVRQELMNAKRTGGILNPV